MERPGRHLFTLRGIVVVSHLESCAAEAALHIKPLVVLAAVQDGLVAAGVGGDEVESLDDAQAQLLALLVLCHGDVLDVADGAQRMDTEERGGVSAAARGREQCGLGT